MDKYTPTIGLEVHVELKTRTKMFCSCLNDPKETRPNKNVCPVCLAHPGTLPVINVEAVKKTVKVGLAMNGKIAKKSFFDRKNYFYPDLPKGYQISQYQHPLVLGGQLVILNEAGKEKKIQITRIHLEEDTGKLSHQDKSSLVDYNRAGVPLMELVTEPVIHSGFEARRFAEELRLLLRYLDVSDADMESGQMRIEPNISISKTGKLGIKVEVKNLNSFRSVEDSINFEIQRQTEVLESGGKIHQHNRGWNQEKSETFEQRSKEEAHDYRYFPEPDLPPLVADAPAENGEILINTKEIEKQLPELPWQKRERLVKLYGLEKDQVELLVQDMDFCDFFEKTVSEMKMFDQDHKSEPEAGKSLIVFNVLASDVRGTMKAVAAQMFPTELIDFSNPRITPVNLAHLIEFFHQKKISSRVLKDVLLEMFETGKDPEEIISAKNLLQMTDDSMIEALVLKVIKDNPVPSADFRSGKEQALQFLIGKIMAETKGRANPQTIQELIRKNI